MNTTKRTRTDAERAMNALGGYIGRSQLCVLRSACYGEEREFFYDKLAELAALVDAMPKTYEQDGKGDEALVTLHYFSSGSDWYITEKDASGGTSQAFGYAILNGDGVNAELGYIDIGELIANGVEMDLYFKPRTLGEVKVA